MTTVNPLQAEPFSSPKRRCTSSQSSNTVQHVSNEELLLKLLFDQQRSRLSSFFDHLSYPNVCKLLEACLQCPGSIIFTGVGKSGFVAQKLAQTLISLSIPALFLDPHSALHGDLGAVRQGDLVILLSKSGCTDELLRLVPFLKERGCQCASVTCIKGSPLEAQCNLAVHLPLDKELCPYNLTPVTSPTLQMLFGDTLIVAIMQARGISPSLYADNHPAGRIGRRLTLTVESLMISGTQVPLVKPATCMSEALVEVTSKSAGCVLVTDNGQLGGTLQGIFTDGDLRRALARYTKSNKDVMALPLSTLMTHNPRRCKANTKAVDAVQMMEQAPKVNVLPVVDEKSCVLGLITLHILVSADL